MDFQSMKAGVSKAVTHLSEADQVMAQLIEKHGDCMLYHREYNPFRTLVRSIISQQLSAKAADTIERRVLEIVQEFNPTNLLNTNATVLREAGLSASKSRYIHEISSRVQDGRLDFDNLTKMSNQEAIDLLTEIPGIGKWTAEMFLIFGLGRPDVLSLGDAGLKRSVRLLYGEMVELDIVGERWKPFRSVASWYLWKHLDS